MIHVLVGAALPLALFLLAWWRRRRRTSARALGWLAAGASLSGLVATLPDLPRLVHNADLYFRMHRHPACNLAWFHCFIDRHDDLEDSRIIPVVFVLAAAAVVLLGWRELAALEAASADAVDDESALMAHATFHMAAGMALGTALTIAPVARAFIRATPLARPLGRLYVTALGLGLFALAPSFLTLAGAPLAIHHASWANVFVGHAAIANRVRGGLLLGQLGLVAIFAFHYALLVAAVAVAQRRQRARGA